MVTCSHYCNSVYMYLIVINLVAYHIELESFSVKAIFELGRTRLANFTTPTTKTSSSSASTHRLTKSPTHGITKMTPIHPTFRV